MSDTIKNKQKNQTKVPDEGQQKNKPLQYTKESHSHLSNKKHEEQDTNSDPYSGCEYL